MINIMEKMKEPGSILKLVIVLVLVIGELVVWTFPYEQVEKEWADPQAGQPPIGQEEPTGQVPLENSEDPPVQEAPNEPEEPEEAPAAQETPDTQPQPAEIGQGLLILVNKSHYLETDYKPSDLSPIHYYAKDRSAESRYMRAEAADQFNRMAEAALSEGVEIVMTTAYRSYGFQSVLYNNYVTAHGQQEADKYSAKPGSSEHQTGLAVDLSAPSVDYALTVEFDKTQEWAWLEEHAAEYGFILRYPKGKSQITGYMYEPWHFRYVGLEHAQNIKRADITLEEYLN